MAISKLNSEQYANLLSNAKGILLVYAGKEGKSTAIHFFGNDFEPTEKTQDALFAVLKNLVQTHWTVKIEETNLRERNDAIRSKLRASTPSQIIIRTDKGDTVKKYDLTDSVWSKIGIMPTKKDLERSTRDRAKYIHNAAKAMMDALNFRIELPKSEVEKKPEVKKDIKPADVPAAA